MRAFALIGLHTVLLLGCGEPPPPPPAPRPAPTAAPDPPAPRVVAPSPLELQRQIREAGIADSLADLVPAPSPEAPSDDPDRIALRTGALLAHTLLAGADLPKAEFLARLRAVREGVARIGAAPEVLASIDECLLHVENDTASRDDFLAELDAIVTWVVPRDAGGLGGRTGPLFQAGAWVAGTNVIARAIVRSGQAGAADALLKRPEVPAYFLGYLKGPAGAAQAGGAAAELEATLVQLRELASKPTLGLDDARSVSGATGALLALF